MKVSLTPSNVHYSQENFNSVIDPTFNKERIKSHDVRVLNSNFFVNKADELAHDCFLVNTT